MPLSDSDEEQAFSPQTLRMFLALAAHLNWPIYQLDVNADLVCGKLDEVVYMSQPEGFVAPGTENMVCKLNKAIYGLNQAPRGWYANLDSYFLESGFQRSSNDPTLYTKKSGGIGGSLLLVVCVYMDDVIYMGSSPSVTTEFKERMINLFEMTDLGLLHYFLGLEIMQGEGGVFVSQTKYAANLLNRFNMTNCEAEITTPMNAGENLRAEDGSGKADARSFRNLVGGLVCLTRTRPDIALAVVRVSEFGRKPTNQHFGVAMRILGYIAGTRDLGIWYSNAAEFKLNGFTCSIWDGDRRSRSGFVFSFGSGAVTWSARKQGVATLSTSEAEYLAAATSACEAMWLRRQLGDLDEEQEEATQIMCGNGITKKPLLHGRTEHIDVKLDLIRELVSGDSISLKFCNDSQQLAHIFTKPLPYEKHVDFTARLGLCTYQSRAR